MIKVEINGEVREVEADQFKLARTIWNKPGEKYTPEEMFQMGFELKDSPFTSEERKCP